MSKSLRGALRSRVLAVLALALFAGSPLMAAEAAGYTDTWLGVPLWVWGLVNLAIFWGLLYRYAFPYVRDHFVKRRQDINSTLDRAQQQRQDVDAMRQDLSRQVAELKAEIDELVERAAQEGERERQRILAQAEEERTRLLEQATGEIEHRAAQARAELVELTAKLAAGMAKERVEQELTPEDRRRLFERGLKQLEEKVS